MPQMHIYVYRYSFHTLLTDKLATRLIDNCLVFLYFLVWIFSSDPVSSVSGSVGSLTNLLTILKNKEEIKVGL